MADFGVWGYVILIGVGLAAIYLFPKVFKKVPEVAETAGGAVEHFQMGRIKARAELKKLQAEIEGPVNPPTH